MQAIQVSDHPDKRRIAELQRRWCFFFQAEDGIRDLTVTGVQTCALPICAASSGLAVDQAELGAPVQITYWSGSYNAQVGANSFRQPLVPRGIEGQHAPNRSEERRVGKECRSRWWPYH